MWLQTALPETIDIPPHSKSLERGVILQRTLQTDGHQKYYLYIPQRGGNNAKIFITVHGISRNVSEHAQKFAVYAEEFGVVLIAPYFPSDRFPDYQPHAPQTAATLERLAREQPQVLACMHGSAWRGGGAGLLRALAASLGSPQAVALAA